MHLSNWPVDQALARCSAEPNVADFGWIVAIVNALKPIAAVLTDVRFEPIESCLLYTSDAADE